MMDSETKDVLEKLLRQLTSGPDLVDYERLLPKLGEPALTRTPMQKAKALRFDDSQLRLSKARENYKESCYAMERVDLRKGRVHTAQYASHLKACYLELLAAIKEAKTLWEDLDLNDPGRITFIMKGPTYESAGG